MNEIQVGDYVRHINPIINGGLRMAVEDIDESGTKAKCSHFVGIEQVHKEDWFDLNDLILVEKADGGFVD